VADFTGRTIGLVLLLTLLGCVGNTPLQTRSQVTYTGTFDQLQQAPDRYAGETVLLGGKVVATQVTEGSTELVVLQLELNSSDQPRDDDRSLGRYLAISPRFLDPALYPPGTLITVVGKVRGGQKRLIGKMMYTYPVIDLVEIRKWSPPGNPSPRFQFGIGVGTHF
jgi:outer membrane lipoprotein